MSKVGGFFKGLFRKTFDGNIMKVLNELASDIADDARQNASSNLTSNGTPLPNEISDAIEVGSVENLGDGRYSIAIKVDLGIAPMAAAYEFGSGERGETGQDYPIVPKDASALHFIWKYPSPLGRKVKPFDEEVYLQKVMHPGVEASPYLQPAIQDNLEKVGRKIAVTFLGTVSQITPRIEWIRPE